MDCPKCGARNTKRAKFCQACGASLVPVVETPPVAEPAPVVVTEEKTDAWTTAARPFGAMRSWSFTPERFVVGDWLGAILACLVALIAMAALAAASMGIAGYDAPAGTWFKRIMAFVALSVGGSANIPHEQSFGGSVSISRMPLTFTLVGFGLLGWITARRLKRAPFGAVDVVLQALRTIIVMVLLLVVVGFVARHGQRGEADYIHVKVAYSAFFGACVTLATLGVTYFVAFGVTLPERARVWRDRFVGPAVGIFTVFCVVVLLATIYALVQVLAIPHDLSTITQAGMATDPSSRRDELAELLAFAPNHALWMLMWAMGVPLTVATAHRSFSWTLTGFTDGHGDFVEKGNGVYWVLPVISAVVWIIGAAAAALFAATPREGRRNSYRMTLLAPLLTSAIFVMAGLAARKGGFLIRMHFSYWWAFLLGLVWAGGAGILAPELVLRLPARVISGLRWIVIRLFGAPPSAMPDMPYGADEPDDVPSVT